MLWKPARLFCHTDIELSVTGTGNRILAYIRQEVSMQNSVMLDQTALRSESVLFAVVALKPVWKNDITVKILKIGTPEIITIIVLQLEQLDFTVQYCVQKMQTE